MLLYMKKFRSLRNFSRIHCSKNVVHSSLCTHVAKIRFSFVTSKKLTRKNSLILKFLIKMIIQVSKVRELTEVKEVITPYGRSGSEETIVILRKT